MLLFLVATAVLCAMISSVIVWPWLNRRMAAAAEIALQGAGSSEAVFIFAHPDDEAMFFTPTLRHFGRVGRPFHFLCFSSGNYRGLGTVRARELQASAALYGAKSAIVVEDRRSQDGPARWDTAFISSYLTQYTAERPEVRLIFTFDHRGVSGHTNHIDVHLGVCRFLATSDLRGYQLYTSPLLLKYTGLLAMPRWSIVPVLKDGFTLAVPREEALFSLKGMFAHASQLVWFRYLFVAFSEYTFVNHWTPISPLSDALML